MSASRSTRHALDAAGITDPGMRAAYETCRKLHALHGRTYYLATLLLPPAKRPHVWALYAFARYADEFVDSLTNPDPAQLVSWGDEFLAKVGDPLASLSDPVAAAMRNTMRRWQIPRAHVEAFLESMRMDITITEYATYADLEKYMYGSAAVIGLQMLPILGPRTPDAAVPARALGEAFQLSNFIRDIGEDLRRGRVYLPMEDLETFGVTREDLVAGVVTGRIRELLRFEIARARALYDFAETGIPMVHPTSRPCLRTALVLYRGILNEVERVDYAVLTRRVSVPMRTRLSVASKGWLQVREALAEQRRWQPAIQS